jgi:hypothetical protein
MIRCASPQPHFKQLFALKGNYDEGFGKEQHKTKWAPSTGGFEAKPVDTTTVKTVSVPAQTVVPLPEDDAPAVVEEVAAIEAPVEEEVPVEETPIEEAPEAVEVAE